MTMGRDTLVDVGQTFQEIGLALQEFGDVITAGLTGAAEFTKEVADASYHLAGQYTFPLNQETNTDSNDSIDPAGLDNFQHPKKPPALSSFHPAGLTALTVPVIVPTILASVTLFPLIGNSIISAVRGFVDFANVAMLDMPEAERISYPDIFGVPTGKDKRNAVRQLYGAPGYLVGACFGFSVTAFIAGARFITNNAKSFGRMFATMVNFPLREDWEIDNALDLQHDTRSLIKQCAIGGLGLALGAVIGGIAAAVLAIGRGFINFGAEAATSFGQAFIYMVNLSNSDKDKIPSDVDERPLWKKIVGAPGLMLGGLLGLVVTTIVANAKSFGSGFATMVNFPIWDLEEYKIKNNLIDDASLVEDEKRPAENIFGLGGPGLLLGGVVGGIAAILIALGRGLYNLAAESSTLFVRAFKYMLNFSMAKNDKIPLGEDKQEVWEKVFGAPGLVLGGLFGFITTAIVANAKSFGSAFATMVNFPIWDKADAKLKNNFIDDASLPEDEKRPAGNMFGLGVVGLCLGTVVGSIAAILVAIGRGIYNLFVESADSFVRSLVYMLNLSNAKKHEIVLEEDKRTTWEKVFGAPGLVLGGLFGLITTAIVANAKSFGSAFATMVNFPIWDKADAKLKNNFIDDASLPEDEKRPAGNMFGLGVVGLCLGTVVGSIAAILVAIGRGIYNLFVESGNSFGRTFIYMLNLSNAKKHEIGLEEDKRATWEKVFGAPGLVLGGLFGFITTAIVANAKSFGSAFATMVNFPIWDKADAKLKNNFIDDASLPADEKRPAGNIFGLGVVGLCLGTVVGSIAAILVAIGRGIYNLFVESADSFVRSLVYMLNLSNAKKHEIVLEEDKRTTWEKVFGAPGLVLGGLFGFITTAIVANAKSFGSAFATMVNFPIWDKADAKLKNNFIDDVNLPEDEKRPAGNMFGLGVVGLCLGAVVGSIAAILVAIGRGLYNLVVESSLSFAGTFIHMLNFALPQTKKIPLEEDKRATWEKVFGAPGIVLGGIVGGVVSLIIANVKSFGSAFAMMVNFPLWDLEEYKIKNNLIDDANLPEDERRHAGNIYGCGALGLGLGIIIGSVAVLLVGLVRAVLQGAADTWLSFKALSGSLLNGVTNRVLSAGLGGDERSPLHKGFGGLGYVLAAALVGPLAVLGMAAQYSLAGLGVITGIVASPLFMLGKSMGRGLENVGIGDKFANMGADIVATKFRNLFSSLNVYGKFSPGSAIVENGSGKESVGLFAAKSLKFNTKSLTENVLNILLAAYRKSGSKADFFDDHSPALKQAIEEVKDRYVNGCLNTAESYEDNCTRIDKVVKFVLSYLKDDKALVPADIYDVAPRPTRFAKFWGEPKPAKAATKVPITPAIDADATSLVPA